MNADTASFTSTPADPEGAGQQSSEQLGTALYAAALGPLNAPHYLAAFERLEATGRVLPGWNWAAAVTTLVWMAFRGLWRALAGYLAGLGVLALALWGLWQVGTPLPVPVLAGLALAAVLLAFVLPGLYGDVLVHRQVRRQVDAAVAAAPSLRDAMLLLQARAPNKPRLLWLTVGSAAALMTLVALGAWGCGGWPIAPILRRWWKARRWLPRLPRLHQLRRLNRRRLWLRLHRRQ
ncbi:hypothetical protein MASR1M59_23310 [Melaminivora sp.]